MTIKEVIKKFNLDYTAAWWLPKVVEPDKKVQLENCYFYYYDEDRIEQELRRLGYIN